MSNTSINVMSRLLNLMEEDETLPDLFPLSLTDYPGFGAAILGLLLASGGGIGGGGILVPIYILILEFPVKHAIPLASTTVFGGAIANNILNARKVHPNYPERPAIDWDLILQLEPMTIAGALIGVDLNKELPEVVLLVLMLLLLAVTAQKTLTKAFKMYREETIRIKLAEGNEIKNENTPLVRNGTKNHIEVVDVETNADEVTSNDDEKYVIQRQCRIDAMKLLTLFSMITILTLLQGSPDDTGPMGLPRCGTACYWITEFLIFAFIVLFSLYNRYSILKRQGSGIPAVSEIVWDENNTIKYPCLAILAGLVAGMFGIGGGIVKGPLMLALGVHPQVSSATSACMILFTTGTSTLEYLIFGYLKYDYATFCLLIGFFSTLAGQTVMTVLMERSGQRNSYIAFSIGLVVAISAIAMGIQSAIAIFGM